MWYKIKKAYQLEVMINVVFYTQRNIYLRAIHTVGRKDLITNHFLRGYALKIDVESFLPLGHFKTSWRLLEGWEDDLALPKTKHYYRCS